MAQSTRTVFVCFKCQHTECETAEFRAAGGNFAKFADVQSKQLTTVSCQRCGYTEPYKGDTSMLGNILDFFVGG